MLVTTESSVSDSCSHAGCTSVARLLIKLHGWQDLTMIIRKSVHLRSYTDILPCDQIQYPPPGPFCSTHLKWYSSSCWIPEDRLPDFIEGEEHRPLVNTNFKTQCTERFPCPQTGVLLRTKKRFHCCYGPLDYRNQVEENLPDKRTYENGKVPLRHTTLTGYSARRGCTCRWFVSRFANRPHAVQITWVQREHVNKQGRPCHGFADPCAQFYNAHVAPRLSRRTWHFIERLIRTGVSSTEIVKAHFRNLREHWRSFFPNEDDPRKTWSRDMMLTPKDVKSVRQSVLRKKVDFNTADHLAVHTWTETNKEKVFLYQQKTDADAPFLLGWASEWQMKKAATLGHGRPLAMDATFGTNVFDMHLFTVLAYDNFQNDIPIAWAIMERAKSEHIILFLQKLKERVETHRSNLVRDSEWKPSCFLIDVAAEEILALTNVFPGVPINLCFWHVRRAWTKNLVQKVKNAFHRADMSREMGDLMYNCGDDHVGAVDKFVECWTEQESTFIAYFKTYWVPKMERWMKKFRHYDHANQNTNGGVERWHHILKTHLRTEKATKNGRSVIWLLGMLSEDMEHFYWCMLALKFQGAIRNKVRQNFMFAAIHKARLIADEQITYVNPGSNGESRVEVRTYKENGEEKVHLVQCYNTDNATCTCGHSEQGNTCKHQIKLLLMDGYSEMKLFNLLGTKWGTCCGGLQAEYEAVTGETVLGEEDVARDIPDEIDISFPLKTFSSIAEEDEAKADESDEPYHCHSREYYLRLVNEGYSKLETLGSGIKNQALVRLKGWLEWITNEEAASSLDFVENFPTIGFERPEGGTNSLARKKDCIELFWQKHEEKGPRRKDSSESEGGVHKKKKQTVDGHESGWQAVQKKLSKEGGDDSTKEQMLLSQSLACHESKEGQAGSAAAVPFVQKKRIVESHQDYLQRLARESLNLNTHPMDYEPPTPPASPLKDTAEKTIEGNIAMTKSKGGTKAKAKEKAATQGKTQVAAGNTMVAAPKRRGHPPGSKNKPKAVLITSSLPAKPVLSTVKSKAPLASLPENVVACMTLPATLPSCNAKVVSDAGMRAPFAGFLVGNGEYIENITE